MVEPGFCQLGIHHRGPDSGIQCLLRVHRGSGRDRYADLDAGAGDQLPAGHAHSASLWRLRRPSCSQAGDAFMVHAHLHRCDGRPGHCGSWNDRMGRFSSGRFQSGVCNTSGSHRRVSPGTGPARGIGQAFRLWLGMGLLRRTRGPRAVAAVGTCGRCPGSEHACRGGGNHAVDGRPVCDRWIAIIVDPARTGAAARYDAPRRLEALGVSELGPACRDLAGIPAAGRPAAFPYVCPGLPGRCADRDHTGGRVCARGDGVHACADHQSGSCGQCDRCRRCVGFWSFSGPAWSPAQPDAHPRGLARDGGHRLAGQHRDHILAGCESRRPGNGGIAKRGQSGYRFACDAWASGRNFWPLGGCGQCVCGRRTAGIWSDDLDIR